MRGARQQSGSAILEFAIVLPFVFALFVGVVEFSRLLRVREIMSVVTRESANEAYRECFDIQAEICSGAESKLDFCLRDYAERIAESANARLPGVSLTLSLYTYDEIADKANLLGITKSDGEPTESKFDDVKITNEYYELIKRQKVIVVSELFVTYGTFFDVGVGGVTEFDLYDVAIF